MMPPLAASLFPPVTAMLAPTAPDTLASRIESALQEIERKLRPIDADYIKRIANRLMLHYPDKRNAGERRLADYLHALRLYPEDLLCAAYQQAIRRQPQSALSVIADMIAFMAPEMHHRRETRRKLAYQLEQLKIGEPA